MFVCSRDPIEASFLSHSLFCSYWCMHVVGFKFGWHNFLHNERIFHLTKLLSMAILYLKQHMLIANFPILSLPMVVGPNDISSSPQTKMEEEVVSPTKYCL